MLAVRDKNLECFWNLQSSSTGRVKLKLSLEPPRMVSIVERNELGDFDRGRLLRMEAIHVGEHVLPHAGKEDARVVYSSPGAHSIT
jgi:hypothetical protein